jgi:hypothetical protein
MASGEPPKLSSRDIGGLTGAASFRDCISAASATQLGPPGYDMLVLPASETVSAPPRPPS